MNLTLGWWQVWLAGSEVFVVAVGRGALLLSLTALVVAAVVAPAPPR